MLSLEKQTLKGASHTEQKMKFSIKDFFTKCLKKI